MAGRRRRLRIINRPWYHCLTKFYSQITFSIILVFSVAVGVWTLQHEGLKPVDTENRGTVLETFNTMEMEWHIFTKNIESHGVWTNVELHRTCCLLFPAFALLMVGPRNSKRVLCLMAESFCGIFKHTNYIVHGVNFLLLFTFIMIAYAYLVMLYMVCAGVLESYIGLSISEESHSEDLRPENRVKYFHFELDKAPYFTALVTRYDMEDVVMTCSLLVDCEINIPIIFNSFRWIKDGRRVVKKTDKIRIITNAYKWTQDSARVPHCYTFLIVAKLGLEVVDSADYGNYSCEYTRTKQAIDMITPWRHQGDFETMGSLLPFDGFIPYSLPKQANVHQNLEGLTTEIFGIFYFQRQTMSLQEVIILPGGLFIEHVPYWSLADHLDITINKTVSEDCCWLPVWFYKFFYGYRNLVSRAKFGFGRQRFLLRQQCVCSEDFALKDFFFTRTRYNSTMKSKQDIQVLYPEHFKLVLGFPNSFKLTPENDMVSLITARNLLLNGIVYYLALFIIVLIVLWFCLKCLFEVIICVPMVNSLKDLFLVEHQQQGYDYDLYLTYDENDRYEMELANELKEHLDRNTCRLIDPWTDVLPGSSLLDERQRAIDNSRRFCVIISDKSGNDGVKILEFTAIKQTLADRKAAGTETENCKFVIQIGNCARDGFLIPGNAIVSEYFKEHNELEDSVLRNFLKWARSSNKKLSFCHLMKSYGFSIKHSIMVTITTIVFVTCVFYSDALQSYRDFSIENQRKRLVFEAED